MLFSPPSAMCVSWWIVLSVQSLKAPLQSQGMLVNSAAFAALPEGKVPDRDMFFHQFFKR